MSHIEENFAQGYIEMINQAKSCDPEIENLRTKQHRFLNEAYTYYDQFPAVIQYLNNDDATYFMNWLKFHEKRHDL